MALHSHIVLNTFLIQYPLLVKSVKNTKLSNHFQLFVKRRINIIFMLAWNVRTFDILIIFKFFVLLAHLLMIF